MFSYIQITKLNDFIFCPYSLYFHSVYEGFDTAIFHDTYQTRGKIKHNSIDNQIYSTAKDVIQGLPVYSHRLKIAGKIDLYFKKKQLLLERKYKITHIYDGYKLQLYAQYYCMTEMGYKIKKLAFHSLVDNKIYEIPLPTKKDLKFLKSIINKIQNFDIEATDVVVSPEKCKKCIYNNLCVFRND